MTTTPIAAGPNDVTVRPAAWMHDQPDRFDVIHAEAKALWLKAWPKQVEHYTIPLYRHQERQPLSKIPLLKPEKTQPRQASRLIKHGACS